MQLQDIVSDIDTLKGQLESDQNNIELLLKIVELYLRLEGEEYDQSLTYIDRILEIDPINLAANRIRGLIYQDMDQPEKALECFKKIVENYNIPSQHPEYLEIYFDYGQALEEIGNDQEALELFLQLYRENANDIAILLKLAHLYTVSGDNDVAISYYKQILAVDPDNQAALSQLVELYELCDKRLYHLTKAEQYLKEGKPPKTIVEYKKVIPLAIDDNDEADIHKKIASIYVIQCDYNNALDEYNLAYDLIGHDYAIYKGLGEIYFETEDFEGAVESYQKAIELKSDDYSIYIDLAEAYLELEMYPEALRELETAKKHEPENLDIRCSIAESYLKIRDSYKAQEEINYTLVRDPDHIRSLGILVDVLLFKEDLTAALEISKKLVKLIPNSSFSARKLAEVYEASSDEYNTYYNYGLACELQSEYGAAIDEYEHAYELKPENIDLLMKIGDLYFSMGEKFIGIEYYERALEVEESNTYVLNKLAAFYMQSGQLQKATDTYMAIVEHEKNNTEAIYELAQLLEKQKYNEDALDMYSRFLELAPTSTKTENVHKKVLNIKKKLGYEVDEIDDSYYEGDMTVFQKVKNVILNLLGR